LNLLKKFNKKQNQIQKLKEELDASIGKNIELSKALKINQEIIEKNEKIIEELTKNQKIIEEDNALLKQKEESLNKCNNELVNQKVN